MKEVSVIEIIKAATKILNTKEVADLPEELNELLESYIEEYGETNDWKFNYFNSWDLIQFYEKNEVEEVSVQLEALLKEVAGVEMLSPIVFYQVQDKMVLACTPKAGFTYGD